MKLNPTRTLPTNVMLDIETYGLSPGSVIKSIGAVKFALGGPSGKGEILDRFYRRIDAQSCVAAGLTMDASTVEWWLGQSDSARHEMALPGEKLQFVLEDFTLWVNDQEADIWGNGAAYDNVLVACAYTAVGLPPPPWAHRHSLCYRTVKNANKDIPIDAYRTRTHHNALDDAESQALHLMAIWDRDAKRAAALDMLAQAVRGAKGVTDLPGVQNILSPEALIVLSNWMTDARSLIS